MLNDVRLMPHKLNILTKIYDFDVTGRKRKREDIKYLQWGHGITKSFACQYNVADDVFEFPRSKVHLLLLNGMILSIQILAYIEDIIRHGRMHLKQAYERLKKGKHLLTELLIM